MIKIMEIRLKITGLQENHLFKKKLLRVLTIQTMQTAARHPPELKTPRTKKELEDALGTVNESGKWTPPAGSHIDPKTGNILNKDGVVVGTTQEPYSKARPGSQG